jgi:hypothetical protein
MKIHILLPFLVLAGLVLIIGLACGTTANTIPPTLPPAVAVQPTKTQPEQVQPTETQPTKAQPATEAPTVEAQAYFTDDQFVDMSNWTYFVFKGDENDMTIKNDTGVLKFDLEGKDIWVYLMYDPYTYTDVRIDATVDNRGKNNNNVSLICRYGDEGWYEFNIANNGLYWILAYINADKQYYTIYNGGSNAIKQGKDVNDYTIGCVGSALTLWINGSEVRTVKDTIYNLREGQIGVGVSSFDVTPIIVEWDSISISQP